MNHRIHVCMSALIFALALTPAAASASSCKAGEKEAANEQLLAIVADATRSANIIERHLPHGVHTSTHASQGVPDNETLLLQEGYALKHDKDLRTTLWVSYSLTSDDIDGAAGQERVNCFRRDPRMSYSETGVPADYSEPIFDQGHMANDADMKDNLTEQLNTYIMSNMSPQYCRFNRGIWLSLEGLGRIWAKQYGEIYITSGAIFDYNSRDKRDKDESVARMGSRNQKARVAIPSDYYKIFLRKEGSTWRSISFLLEHNNEANGRTWSDIRPVVKIAIRNIEDIESVAEVSFHPGLDRSQLVQGESGWDFGAGKSNLEGACK